MDKEMGVITYNVDEFASKQRRKLSHKLSKFLPSPRVRVRRRLAPDKRLSELFQKMEFVIDERPKRPVPYQQTEEFDALYYSLLRKLQTEYLADAELTPEREATLRLLVDAFIVMLNENGMNKRQIRAVLVKLERELSQALDQEIDKEANHEISK